MLEAQLAAELAVQMHGAGKTTTLRMLLGPVRNWP
jgi:hypothetical protein